MKKPNKAPEPTTGSVMTHESRQLASWLLFDVGRDMRPLFTLLLIAVVSLSGCGSFTDGATRIANDIEANVKRLSQQEGATFTIRHATPSKTGDCAGPFKVQFDKVGLLVIWCKDSGGQVVASHSTSYHRRFIDTAETYIVEKPAGAVLLIQIERKNGRAVITKVS